MNKKRSIQHSSSDALRPRLLEAARSRFKRFGYSKTTMQELAGDCSMSAANLYRFYEGKLEIGIAVASAEQSQLFKACDKAVAVAHSDAHAHLVAFFHALIEATRQQLRSTPLLFELRLIVTNEKPSLRLDFLNEVENRIVSILANFHTQEAAALGHLILLASAPFVLPWMLQNEPFGDPRPRVAPLIERLLSNPPAGHTPPAPSRRRHRPKVVSIS